MLPPAALKYCARGFAIAAWFMFSVSEGDSRLGKTRYSCALLGVEGTYVCNCKGGKQPFHAMYDLRQHQALVLDGPSAITVENCKAILEAGVVGCELFHSTTQRFTCWFCVYKVPKIICFNDSITEEAPVDASLQKWSMENSVHNRVTDYVYERPGVFRGACMGRYLRFRRANRSASNNKSAALPLRGATARSPAIR